jgi:2-hydroxychromene-2-carboxylate isomerase
MQQYRNHPLTEAARYNDAQAEEFGIERVVEGSGLDMGAAVHISHQRAMRAVMLTTRGEKFMQQYAKAGIPQVVPMSKAEIEMTQNLTALYLDGILIGWKGHVLQEGDKA